MTGTLLAIAFTTLILGLVGQGTTQDKRVRAQIQPGYYRDGKYVEPVMKGIGKPSYTFTLLIISAVSFAVAYRAYT